MLGWIWPCRELCFWGWSVLINWWMVPAKQLKPTFHCSVQKCPLHNTRVETPIPKKPQKNYTTYGGLSLEERGLWRYCNYRQPRSKHSIYRTSPALLRCSSHPRSSVAATPALAPPFSDPAFRKARPGPAPPRRLGLPSGSRWAGLAAAAARDPGSGLRLPTPPAWGEALRAPVPDPAGYGPFFLLPSLLKVSKSSRPWAGPGARHSGERGAEAP